MELTFVRINDNFEPHIIVDKLVEIQEEKAFDLPCGQLYYQLHQSDEVRFITYGLKGKDQWWSSNCATINKHFNLKTTECAVKELEGQYSCFFAMGVFVEDIQVPECLEFRNGSFYLKNRYNFPRGKDYFMSTRLNEKGELIYPLSK